MNKYLFLDIDGVLSLYGTGSGSFSINKKRLRLLRNLVEETGCLIILSSTWRLDEKHLVSLKKSLGYKKVKISSCTPHFPSLVRDEWINQRVTEIRKWLELHGEEPYKYAVIDDMPLIDFRENFFQTDPRKGLTLEIKEAIVQLLNGERNDTA